MNIKLLFLIMLSLLFSSCYTRYVYINTDDLSTKFTFMMSTMFTLIFGMMIFTGNMMLEIIIVDLVFIIRRTIIITTTHTIIIIDHIINTIGGIKIEHV